MQDKIKVLVVDDLEQNLILISRFVTKLGHQVVTAYSGEEAIAVFEREKPDMVLMDIMMPGMDGYEATIRIKELSAHKWIPVVFLSAMSQEESLVRGLEVGGDDYLTKPVNLVVLRAKINAMLRIVQLQEKLADKTDKLEEYYFITEDEKRIAKHLMDHIVNIEKLNDAQLEFFTEPAQGFNGDLLAAARTPGDILHVLLADGTGHGLSAAINVMLLIQPFYAMTEKGFSISSIVEEMNAKLKSAMPADRFVAATFVSIDMRNRIIEVWNGGNPASMLLSKAGEVIRRFAAKHLPLGILSAREFKATTEIYQWEEPVQFLVCSDGVTEADSPPPDKKMFGIEGVLQSVATVEPEERLENLVKSVKEHLGGIPANDDLSIALVNCPVNKDDFKPKEKRKVKRYHNATSSFEVYEEDEEEYLDDYDYGIDDTQDENDDDDFNAVNGLNSDIEANIEHNSFDYWKFELSLGFQELKYIDAVPIILNVINEIHIAKEHSSQLFLIISELYNNALDHGILKLNSTLKLEADGMDHYLNERKLRLNYLTEGSIEISFECVHYQGKPALRIHFKDSGEGFDYQSVMNRNSLEQNFLPFGRGISLVKILCLELNYTGKGNEVVVYYDLSSKKSN